MKRMLYNATQAEELRVAIVDGQTLLDFDIETVGQEIKKGNIYKGTITRVEPSLEACFIDYGTDKQGFLPFKEVSRNFYKNYDKSIRPKIQEVLKEGMQVLVQVEKDERGNKGAALTTYISLAGRYLVLMPNNPKAGGISRRIDGDDRQEIKEVLSNLKVPRGMSVIARTAGIGRRVEDLEWDLNYLVQLWKAILNAYNKSGVQNLLLQESDLVIRSIRDYFQPDISEILIDNDEIYNKVYQFISLVMPNNLNRVKLYKDNKPLFVRFHIEDQIESAYNRVVELEHGGSIVIDHTEALVSIDVNSSKSTKGSDVEETAFKTNLDAVKEITRQIRLRDLGGLIVIDFIDMLNQKNQREIENTLREYLKKDRARIQMSKISKFGLLELSRQRLQLSLGESSHIMCPRCNGTGFIRSVQSTALQVLRLIQQQSEHATTLEIQAQLPVEVATFLLNEKRSELSNLESISGKPITLIPNLKLETPNFEILKITEVNLNKIAIPSYERLKNNEQLEKLSFNNKMSNLQSNVKKDVAAVNIINHINKAPDNVVKESLVKKLSTFVKDLFSENVKKIDNKNYDKKNSNLLYNKKFKNNYRRNFNYKKKDFVSNINTKNIDIGKNNNHNQLNKSNINAKDTIDTNKNSDVNKKISSGLNSHTNNVSKVSDIKFNKINVVDSDNNIQDNIQNDKVNSNNVMSSYNNGIKNGHFNDDNKGSDLILVETEQNDSFELNNFEDKSNKLMRRLDKNIVKDDVNLSNSINMEQVITKTNDN